MTRKRYKLRQHQQVSQAQPSKQINPALSQEQQIASLQHSLQTTRDKHFTLQCMKMKTKDQLLMLNALEVEIGYILLELEELNGSI